MTSPINRLAAEFGQIDIYLFDQLLRGRITPRMRVLDAGCGAGRNLVYLLREGYEVFGADPDSHSIQQVQRLAASLAPELPASNFRVEAMEAMSFAPEFAEVVISSAVLHFARDTDHFNAMLRGSWSCLKPGGVFFCRLASNIGMPGLEAGRPVPLPDGSIRYLVSEEILARATTELGGESLDPLKTTIVQNQRCMTTWVLRKFS